MVNHIGFTNHCVWFYVSQEDCFGLDVFHRNRFNRMLTETMEETEKKKSNLKTAPLFGWLPVTTDRICMIWSRQSVSRGVRSRMKRTYRGFTHQQRSGQTSTNPVRFRLPRRIELSNRIQEAVTEKTWTPILVVKGVYYKSFLHSVVAVYLTAGSRSPSVSCLPFMNDQKIRIFHSFTTQ